MTLTNVLSDVNELHARREPPVPDESSRSWDDVPRTRETDTPHSTDRPAAAPSMQPPHAPMGTPPRTAGYVPPYVPADETRASADGLPAGGPPTPSAAFEPPPHNLPHAMQQYREPWIDPTGVSTLRLEAIRIEGLKDMRPSFLASLCRPYVDVGAAAAPLADLRYGDRVFSPKPGVATDFRALLATTTSLGLDLSRLDVVKDIAAQLEPSMLPTATPEEAVDLVLRCKPAGRYFLKSSTSLGNSEGTASVQGKIRNVFGGAESVEGTATLGTRTRHSYHGSFTAPIAASPDLWFNASVLNQHCDMTSYASAHEGLTSLRTALAYARGDGTKHELAYEAAHRRLHHLLPDASVAIRKLAQPSIKSAITYTMERDTRDDPLMPTVGSLHKAKLEYSGLGGDTSFVKAEAQSLLSRAFGNGCAWSLAVRGGLLHTLDGHASCFSDRFLIGGPTCVRMFRLNSLGPKEKNDSLGGDAYWTSGLSVIAPIPWREHWPVKLHSFLNAGQIAQVAQTKPVRLQNYHELLQPSASTGVGVLFQQGPLRLELNFGLPLLARKSDSARKGIQFGVGITYL